MISPEDLRDLAAIVRGDPNQKYPHSEPHHRAAGMISSRFLSEAARREAEAKPQKRCDRLNPPVCLHPEACKSTCTFGEGAMAYASEREGPGSAAAHKLHDITEPAWGFVSGTIEDKPAPAHWKGSTLDPECKPAPLHHAARLLEVERAKGRK